MTPSREELEFDVAFFGISPLLLTAENLQVQQLRARIHQILSKEGSPPDGELRDPSVHPADSFESYANRLFTVLKSAGIPRQNSLVNLVEEALLIKTPLPANDEESDWKLG